MTDIEIFAICVCLCVVQWEGGFQSTWIFYSFEFFNKKKLFLDKRENIFGKYFMSMEAYWQPYFLCGLPHISCVCQEDHFAYPHNMLLRTGQQRPYSSNKNNSHGVVKQLSWPCQQVKYTCMSYVCVYLKALQFSE